MVKRPLVAVSGGFDPVHAGHVRMILEAGEHGDVLVILNSDDWLMRKKGYVFMPWAERAEILSAFKGVKEVVSVDDTDGSVCHALRFNKPDMFFNGGDRKPHNTPENSVCEELGIKQLFSVGGEKIQSSSELVKKVLGKK